MDPEDADPPRPPWWGAPTAPTPTAPPAPPSTRTVLPRSYDSIQPEALPAPTPPPPPQSSLLPELIEQEEDLFQGEPGPTRPPAVPRRHTTVRPLTARSPRALPSPVLSRTRSLPLSAVITLLVGLLLGLGLALWMQRPPAPVVIQMPAPEPTPPARPSAIEAQPAPVPAAPAPPPSTPAPAPAPPPSTPAPAPAPPQPPRHLVPTGPTQVVIVGERPRQIRLSRGATHYALGPVPPGTYVIEASFGDGALRVMGSLTLRANEGQVPLRCTHTRCNRE